MQTLIVLIILKLGLYVLPAHAVNSSQQSLLKYLKSTKTDITKNINNLEQQVTTHFNQIHKLSRSSQKNFPWRRLDDLEKEISRLSEEKKEQQSRQHFIDRLIFQTTHKYNGQSIRPFLKKTLLQMAAIELQSPKPNKNLWKFMTRLSKALEEHKESYTNATHFITSYMKFSTVLKPKNPAQYTQASAYSNGLHTAEAAEMAAEEIGNIEEPELPFQPKVNTLDLAKPSLKAPLAVPSSQTQSQQKL